MYIKALLLAATVALASIPTYGADESSQVGQGAVDRIEALVGTGQINDALAKEAIAVINDLLATTRADQNSIYSFVRTINRNIDSLGNSEYAARIRLITRNMMESSYTDQLFQNANLSNQIKTRLPLLIEDSLKLKDNEARQDDFLSELDFLADRFLSSKRFRVGLGIGYSYLPSVSYQGISRIDFSPFQSTISGGSDLLQYHTDFSNKSFVNFMLSTKVPFFQIDATFPKLDDTKTAVTGVQFRDIDSTDRDILSRSTITSKLDIEYEISVKFSLDDAIAKWTDSKSTIQGDLGIGIGLTGFLVKDDISTDVRFRTDGSTPFNDLMPGETLTSSVENSFNSPFWIAYYALEISDEFLVGFDTRWYMDTNSSNNEVGVEDITISLYAIWYPTFAWQ